MWRSGPPERISGGVTLGRITPPKTPEAVDSLGGPVVRRAKPNALYSAKSDAVRRARESWCHLSGAGSTCGSVCRSHGDAPFDEASSDGAGIHAEPVADPGQRLSSLVEVDGLVDLLGREPAGMWGEPSLANDHSHGSRGRCRSGWRVG